MMIHEAFRIMIVLVVLDVLSTTILYYQTAKTVDNPYEMERNPMGRYLMKTLPHNMWIPIMFVIAITMHYALLKLIYHTAPTGPMLYIGVVIGMYSMLLYIHTLQIIDTLKVNVW